MHSGQALARSGSVILGILLFHEPATVGRMLCVVLIIAGIVGLRLFTDHNNCCRSSG